MSTYAISVTAAIIGAAVAIITNYWRTRYTIRSQDFSKRIEELCKLIGELEVAACKFWSNKKKAEPHDKQYILGLQAKLSLLTNYLDGQYRGFSTQNISSPLSDFFDGCSGGDFDDIESSEPQRIRRIMVDGEKLKIKLLETRGGLY
ncbi:hypothetical protein AB7M33_000087 [Pseudomonas sp. Y3 TE3536]